MNRNTDPLYAEVNGNDAEYCRRKGWKPGTRLVGDEGYGPAVIVITAIGETAILAKLVEFNGKPPTLGVREGSWTLECRDWTEARCQPSPPAPRLSGEFCSTCGGANMARSGSCMTCQDCGTTTGCS